MLFLVYFGLAFIGFIGTQYSLHLDDWVTEITYKIQPGEIYYYSGFPVLDVLIVFFNQAFENWVGVMAIQYVFAFNIPSLTMFIVEASRRRSTMNQWIVAAFPLASQLFGICMVLPIFVGLLNRSKPRDLSRDSPLYDFSMIRSAIAFMVNFICVVLLIILRSTSGGNVPLLVAFLLAPIVPYFYLPFDWGGGDLTHKFDREFSHYGLIANFLLCALVGLITHVQFLNGVLFHTELLAVKLTTPIVFLLVDIIITILASYIWLQMEAMEQIKAYFTISNNNKYKTGSYRFFSWRDIIAIIVFGPCCHFSLACAVREFGLMKLDGLKMKST